GHSRFRLQHSGGVWELPAVCALDPTAFVSRKPGAVRGPGQEVRQRLLHWRLVPSCTFHVISFTLTRRVSEGSVSHKFALALLQQNPRCRVGLVFGSAGPPFEKPNR